MHTMRKLLLSLLLFPLTLFSCGKSHEYGHYAFQMGSDKSTHFGVYTDLINEDVYGPKDPENPDGEQEYKGKKFKFGMRVSENVIPDPTVDPTIEKLFLYFFLLLINTEADPEAYLEGYFKIGEKQQEDLGKRLHMTITINSEFIPGFDFPEWVAEKFMLAYIDKKEIKLIMPVSLEDIQSQFCWYGLYINIYSFTYETIEEGKKKYETGYDAIVDTLYDKQAWIDLGYPDEDHLDERVGTHPSQYDINQMNEKFYDIFHTTAIPELHREVGEIPVDFTFRDYNSLTIELLKD